MGERLKITSYFELKNVCDDEVIEGYLDGLRNEPECGNNRSDSYWHGWRNGMVDGGHAKKDGEQIKLAKSYIREQPNENN